jgi:hypothetical protein
VPSNALGHLPRSFVHLSECSWAPFRGRPAAPAMAAAGAAAGPAAGPQGDQEPRLRPAAGSAALGSARCRRNVRPAPSDSEAMTGRGPRVVSRSADDARLHVRMGADGKGLHADYRMQTEIHPCMGLSSFSTCVRTRNLCSCTTGSPGPTRALFACAVLDCVAQAGLRPECRPTLSSPLRYTFAST